MKRFWYLFLVLYCHLPTAAHSNDNSLVLQIQHNTFACIGDVALVQQLELYSPTGIHTLAPDCYPSRNLRVRQDRPLHREAKTFQLGPLFYRVTCAKVTVKKHGEACLIEHIQFLSVLSYW